MKNFYSFFTLVGLCVSYVSAQPSFTVADKDAAKNITRSVLAVVIKEKDEKIAKKLSKDSVELKAYETGLATFNNYIKDAVQQEWNISKEVRFITEAEAEKLKEEKNQNINLLEVTEVKNYKVGDFYSPASRSGFNTSRDLAYHLSPSGNSTALTIVNPQSPNREIATSYLPVVGISSGSVTFMILHLKNQIMDCVEKDINGVSDLKKDIEKRQAALKSRTLLIFDPLISNGLQKNINKNELGKFYDFKYEVASFEKADVLIKEKNPGYAYIWVVPAGAVSGGKPLFNYFIIDAADARILYMTGKAVVGANGDFHQAHLMMVNKELK